MVSSTLLSSVLLLGAGLSAALPFSSKKPHGAGSGTVQCPVVLSGFVKASLQPTDLDSYATSPFNPDYVRGSDDFSQIVLFPAVSHPSRFDNSTTKPIEVTLNDRSIFKTQYGFRRVGLQIQGDTNVAGPGTQGVRTLHWSVKQDPARRMNLTHEYLNVWHEAADYSSNQFNFEAGTIIGSSNKGGNNKNTFKFLDRKNVQVWSTPIHPTAWQNFAITLDFDKNTIQIYYSKNDEPLRPVTPKLANDNSGGGQYQIGMLKKPTGTTDVVNAGYQESNLDEGQIYGGIFLEDSAGGCISL